MYKSCITLEKVLKSFERIIKIISFVIFYNSFKKMTNFERIRKDDVEKLLIICLVNSW